MAEEQDINATDEKASLSKEPVLETSELEDDEKRVRKPGRGIYLLPNLFTTASLFSGFYAIVAGWLIGSFAGSGLDLLGMNDAADWLTGFGTARNLILMVIFMLLVKIMRQ